MAMRSTVRSAPVLVAALALSVMISGCSQGASDVPKPDAKGDAAFVTKLKHACVSAAAVKPLDSSQVDAASLATAQANYNSVNALQTDVRNFAQPLSDATPLAATITSAADMLQAASLHYKWAIAALQTHDAASYVTNAGLAQTRVGLAQADLAKLGASGCLS